MTTFRTYFSTIDQLIDVLQRGEEVYINTLIPPVYIHKTDHGPCIRLFTEGTIVPAQESVYILGMWEHAYWQKEEPESVFTTLGVAQTRAAYFNCYIRRYNDNRIVSTFSKDILFSMEDFLADDWIVCDEFGKEIHYAE